MDIRGGPLRLYFFNNNTLVLDHNEEMGGALCLQLVRVNPKTFGFKWRSFTIRTAYTLNLLLPLICCLLRDMVMLLVSVFYISKCNVPNLKMGEKCFDF